MKNKKRLIQSVVLVIILALVLSYLHLLLLPKETLKELDLKYDYNYCMWKTFYDYEPDTLEIINLGSSHCNCDIIPAYIDETLRVDSYTLATMGNNIKPIYYQLQEILKSQSPKMVTIELFSLFDLDNSSGYYRKAIYGMRPSLNKLHAAQELLPLGAKKILIPLISNHANWQNLSFPQDFVAPFTSNATLPQAGYLLFSTSSLDDATILPLPTAMPAASKPIDEETMAYIQRIHELCERNDIQLIFVVSPFIEQKGYDYAAMLDVVSALTPYCEENNIPIVNYFSPDNGIGLETCDFLDAGHLNVYGAKKLSRHLGNYLLTNFGGLFTDCPWNYQAETEKRLETLASY